MTGSFNQENNRDYNIFITEEELLVLEKGGTLSSEIDYYWNGSLNKHSLNISLLEDDIFRKKAKCSAEELGLDSWKKFMFKAGLATKGDHHTLYLNCDLIFNDDFGGKVFEQRYCEWLFDKVFIFIQTNSET
jgi:hypothetical protein